MNNVILATKTINAINEALERDQGSSYRGWLGKVIGHMGDAFRTDEDGYRSHMGASLIGGECARSIWYSFHWATKSFVHGRLLRLFNRGHLEEARFIALLLSIGCKVYQQDENGNQFRITHANGHFGGAGDGVAVGIPDLSPLTAALTEFKTHNDASFKKLVADGVRATKFEHYVQMNVYMRKMQLPVGLYLAVNKNNDDLYGEIIHLDTDIADRFIDRGANLVATAHAPEKINKSPGFFVCKFCNHRDICHLQKLPERNCRTCQYAEPAAEGTWLCRFDGAILDKAAQIKGCESYELHGSFK